MAASNAWGLFLMVAFLSYALVEVPRRFWQKANRQYSLQHSFYKIVRYEEDYQKAKGELDTTLKVAFAYDFPNSVVNQKI